MEYKLGQRVTVPRLDKGGIVVAVNGGTYTVDFDRDDTATFTAADLVPHD